MKLLPLLLILLFLAGCTAYTDVVPPETSVATIPPETVESVTPSTQPSLALPTLPPEPVYDFTEEEQEMLLKIGMAELGSGECTECVALVMRTILNRVESGRFGSSIKSVLFAQDQFTPVADGSYYKAEPNQLCHDALELVTYGWDESQGALYYEFCDGPSWHSQNLHLLFQHCDTRFYD